MILVRNYTARPFTGWLLTTAETNRLSDSIGWPINDRISVVAVKAENLAPGAAQPFAPQQGDASAYVGMPEPWKLFDSSELARRYVRLYGRMFAVNVWIYKHKEQPGVAQGWALVTCSNAAVPDMTEAAPAIRLDDALGATVEVYGRGTNATLVPPGEVWATGQSRMVFFTAVWLDRLRTAAEADAAHAIAQRLVLARGVAQVFPEGPARKIPNFDPDAWVNAHHGKAKDDLHKWTNNAGLGIVPDSGASGEQEDVVWKSELGEMKNLAAMETNSLSATRWAMWPSVHLEWNGVPCQRDGHPNVMIWDGVPHNASPDKLGKPREPTKEESRGWRGPNDEHWFIGRLCSDYILTGNPATRFLIEQHKELLLWDLLLPSEHNWFTAGARAARSRGWRALAICRIADALGMEACDDLIKRAHRVVTDVWLPAHNRSDGWVDVRVGDPRLGPGEWVSCWQEAVYAYGAMRLAQLLGRADLLSSARRCADRCMADAWREQPDGSWLSWASRPVGPPTTAPDQGFNWFGNCLAAWAAEGERASRLREWLVANAREKKHVDWLPPGAPSLAFFGWSIPPRG